MTVNEVQGEVPSGRKDTTSPVRSHVLKDEMSAMVKLTLELSLARGAPLPRDDDSCCEAREGELDVSASGLAGLRHGVPRRGRHRRACFGACGVQSEVTSVKGRTRRRTRCSVAILAQAISCSNVRGVFYRSRAFLVLSCPKLSTTQFL